MSASTRDRLWTAEEFLQADQYEFGPAWRYELVDGQLVAHAAPSPEHGTIVINLGAVLKAHLRASGSPCRAEAGSGAAPRTQQHATARIPDVLVRCGEHPRVVFEIVSPSETLRERDRKRRHLQDVDGVAEIVDIYQFEAAVHVYRRAADGSSWTFEAIGGLEAVLRLESLGVDIPLTEIYDGVEPPN